ncbi:MAG: cupin domain-containing protein [Bdellovibrio sp.]|jgi:mannose-6-phosphate isomerase-like protein (cupin superfamily)
MIMTRWQASMTPTADQIRLILTQEGLDPFEEVFGPEMKIPDHRHPFAEVRVVLSGELLTNIAGNQVLLRPGDRVEIPSNTRHSYTVQGREPCLCLCAQKMF